jgi:AcrR family transcriptional regulator
VLQFYQLIDWSGFSAMAGSQTSETSSERRQALVLAAYARLASQGFEGLRTRDVAADVGVNVATLHYYFPTKEALIRAVVGHAMRKFGATMPTTGSPADQLRAHLAGIRRLLKEESELFAVLCELALRAPRDPVIARIVDDNDAWHRLLRELLRRGVEQGCLAAHLDPDDAAAVVIAAIRGVSLPIVTSFRPERVDQTFRQLERWLGLDSTEGLG